MGWGAWGYSPGPDGWPIWERAWTRQVLLCHLHVLETSHLNLPRTPALWEVLLFPLMVFDFDKPPVLSCPVGLWCLWIPSLREQSPWVCGLPSVHTLHVGPPPLLILVQRRGTEQAHLKDKCVCFREPVGDLKNLFKRHKKKWESLLLSPY